MDSNMGRKKRYILFNVAGLVIIPYVLTMMVNGIDTVYLKHGPDVEEILSGVLAREIPEDFEKETIKAQAVIARSNLYRKIQDEKNIWKMLKDMKNEIKFQWKIWEKLPDIYEEAGKETEEYVLVAGGKLKTVPYHRLSAGKTRDGAEALHDDEYKYLKSVDSSADKEAENYLSSTYISQQRLPSELNIGERDSSGYILNMNADGNILEGETFSLGMGLPSSDFSMQKTENGVLFLCKGIGHGLGFSQYGGNEMAKEGKSWEEILEKYFPEMEIMIHSDMDVT